MLFNKAAPETRRNTLFSDFNNAKIDVHSHTEKHATLLCRDARI